MWQLHKQGAGGIVGDEMGLGKTVQVQCVDQGARDLASKLNYCCFAHACPKRGQFSGASVNTGVPRF